MSLLDEMRPKFKKSELNDIAISDPQGVGLNLKKFDTGLFYLIGQGTGELPFADLLDFILKKHMFTLIKESNPPLYEKLAKQYNKGSTEYLKTFENNISFVLFLFVRTKGDSFLVDLSNQILTLQANNPQLKPIL